MRRVFELREYIEDPKILARLEEFLERRNRPPATGGDLLTESEIPADFERFAVGHTYGRHRETILTREVRRNGTPEWFDPRVNPGQYGYVSPNGLRVFMQTDLNIESRNAPSVFDEKILALVEYNPEPMSLFGDA
jgi:hypothetical protein